MFGWTYSSAEGTVPVGRGDIAALRHSNGAADFECTGPQFADPM